MSYSSVQTISAGISDVMVANGHIYYYNYNNGFAYYFNTYDDTLYQLSDGSSFGSYDPLSGSIAGGGLFCLGGEIYTLAVNGTTHDVFKWSTGTTWTSVLSVDLSSFAGPMSTLTVGQSYMVFTARDVNGGAAFSDYVVKYTTNGSSWSDGSITWTTSVGFTPQSYTISAYKTGDYTSNNPLLQDTAVDAANGHIRLYILYWTGGGWNEVYTTLTGVADPPPPSWVTDPRFRDLLLWSGSGYEQGAYPTGSFTNPSVSLSPVYSFNFAGAGFLGWGYEGISGSLYVAPLLDTYEWDTTDLVGTGNKIVGVMRSATYYPYVIIQNTANTASAIYRGTTTYPDTIPPEPTPPSAAILYWNGLMTYRTIEL